MHKYEPICFRSKRERRNTDPLYDSTIFINEMNKRNERTEKYIHTITEMYNTLRLNFEAILYVEQRI